MRKLQQKSLASDKSILSSNAELKLSLRSTKYYILLFSCLANAVLYTISSYPQSLESYLLESPYNFTSFQYGVFYCITSLPNIFLPLFVGIYSDKKGYNSLIIMILSIETIFGMIIITCGAYSYSVNMMIVGRLTLGLGSESISMMLKKMVIQISSKNESVVFWGIYLSTSRIGGALSSYIPAFIYSQSNSVTLCFLIGTLIICAACIFASFGFILIGKTHIEKEIGEINKTKNSFELLMEFYNESHPIFWLITGLSIANYMVYYGIFSSENDFLMKAANLDSLESSYFVVAFSCISILFQPVIGYIFSKTGYYIFSIFIGSSLSMVAFIFFIDFFGTNESELFLIPITLYAIGFSFSTTFIFSALGIIVSPKNYGLAYGMLQNSMNIGCLLGPSLFSLIKGETMGTYSGYFWPLVETFTIQSIVSVFAVIIFIFDRMTSKELSSKA